VKGPVVARLLLMLLALAVSASASDDLQVRELRPGVWLHTSWHTYADGTRFPSNGLLVRDGQDLLLVDTACGPKLTRELLDWVDANLHARVRRAIVTHWHDDRLGGGDVLSERGIPFTGHSLTHAIAIARDLPVPDVLPGLEEAGAVVITGPVEVFYPGPAHTRDGVMVYVPAARLLFGSCAVRALDAKDMGNVADGDLAAWPGSIRRARERYAEKTEVVVPGHGAPGDIALLDHTLALLAR
jgi:glyoxylase-like metal-dependent hydrolase (beta-lactamase superfamily II)